MAAATFACARELEFEDRRRVAMSVLLFAIESPTIIILVVAAIFLLFGGSKLPQLAKALGQSKKAFKDGMDDADRDEKLKSDARGSLSSVDDEALFEEARRRAQQMRADETKKIER
jgi:TatA/E family protein of Tat protein translocase